MLRPFLAARALGVVAALALGAGGVSTVRAAPAVAAARHVIVLYQFEAHAPATMALTRGIQSVLGQPGIVLSNEYLDVSRAAGRPEGDRDLARWYAAKYAGHRVDLVVAMGNESLDFLLDARRELWSDVPIVYGSVFSNMGVPRTLPRDVTGRMVRLPIRENLDLALRLFPNARRLAYVGGTSPVDRAFGRVFWEEVGTFRDRLHVTDLAGLTYEEMAARLGTLPDDSVVFGVAVFRDGAGRSLNQSAVADLLTAHARAPVFTISSLTVGHGVIGGVVLDFQEIGREVGSIAERVLAGAAPESIPVAESAVNLVAFDARQLDRWKVPPDRLPRGAEVLFRPPPALYARPPVMAAIVAALSAQAALIAWLLIERRRRRRSERDARETQRQIAHMNRVAVVGELTATLAHEVATPVAAMLNDARAARRFMDGPVARLADARISLRAIEEQGQRARDVLLQMRAAMRKDRLEPATSDLSKAIRDAVHLVESDAREQGVSIEAAFPAAGTAVGCDPVQLQQVLLNLLLNALDAVREVTPDRRRIRIDVKAEPDSAEVVVRDWGKGLCAEDRARLFEPFFTTKPTGLGMGLNISRSIIEAHGGRLGVHPHFDVGVAFSFVLPVAAATDSRPSLEAV